MEYGWADLDEKNKAHYSRRPEWLASAADKLRELEKQEIRTIDDWQDGRVDYSAVEKAQREREQAQLEYDRLYEFWNAQPKKLGIHASNLAEIPQVVTE